MSAGTAVPVAAQPAVPATLLALYLAVFAICAIGPYDRAVWWAENLPIMLIVAILVAWWPRFRFSAAAYILMSVLIIMHTIGGHYTFERVPFGAVTELFGFERNHYDRVAHFSVGFYAYAIAEYLARRRLVNARWLLVAVPVCAILAVAALYEIIEWWFALYAGADAGGAVLGSQGDQWDAQKDMLADGLGALLAATLFAWRHPRAVAAG